MDTVVRLVTPAQDAAATGHPSVDSDGENELDIGLTVGNLPPALSGVVSVQPTALIAGDGVIGVGDRTVVTESAPREVAGYLAAPGIHAWNGHNYAWELTESPGIRDSGSAVRVGWCATTTLRTWTVCQRRSRISMVTASLMETCPDDHACRHCPS